MDRASQFLLTTALASFFAYRFFKDFCIFQLIRACFPCIHTYFNESSPFLDSVKSEFPLLPDRKVAGRPLQFPSTLKLEDNKKKIISINRNKYII